MSESDTNRNSLTNPHTQAVQQTGLSATMVYQSCQRTESDCTRLWHDVLSS